LLNGSAMGDVFREREEDESRSWSMPRLDGVEPAPASMRVRYFLVPAAAVAAVAGVAVAHFAALGAAPAGAAPRESWVPGAEGQAVDATDASATLANSLASPALASAVEEPAPINSDAATAKLGEPHATPSAKSLHWLLGPSDTPGPTQRPFRGPLPETWVSRVVNAKRGEVRRKCGGSGLSGHIVMSLVVSPKGNVQSAHTSGGPAATCACFERNARTWHFPPSDQTTTAEVPFVFLSQEP
jgi:hypothetical protein